VSLTSLTTLGLAFFLTAVLTRFSPLRGWLRGFSVAPYGATLLYLLFFGTFFLGGERSTDSQLLDPLRLGRIALFVLITAMAWLDLVLARKVKSSVNFVTWAMLLYGAIAMATAGWSLNPTLTLWKGFEIVTHVSVVAVIARRVDGIKDALDTLGLFWILLLYVTLSLILSVVISPQEALSHTIKGVAILQGTALRVNPNTATQLSALLLLVGISLAIAPPPNSNRWAIYVLMSLGAVVMFLAHSRTSIFAAAVAILLIAIISRKYWILSLVLMVGTILLVSEEVSGPLKTYIMRGQTEEQFQGLTGRVQIWEIVWSKFLERPILGFGFYAGIRELYKMSAADNTYLQVLMGGGVVLMTVFLIPIFTIAVQLMRSRPSLSILTSQPDYSLLWMQTACVFVLLIVRSVTGPSFDAHHNNLTLFLGCAVAASALIRFRREGFRK